MISNNKTSHLISTQVPDFVRSDHPRFVEFLEAYYRFLEQESEVLNQSKTFLQNLDIDLSESNTFIEMIRDQYIRAVPKDVVVDETLLIKHAKEFYRSKGTEESVRFLARIMFDKEADFYYPKNDILRASDGKWFIEKSLRLTDIRVDNVSNTIAYSNFVNKTLRGATSNAYAIVEKAETYYDKGALVYELKISGQKREFENGEQVYTFYEEEDVEKYLSANLFGGIITSVSIENAGEGYTEGYNIPVESNTGTGAQIVITETTKGSLKALVVNYGGAGFMVNDAILFVGGGGSGASGNVSEVDTSGTVHPNTYNIVSSIILDEANTPLSNTYFSNLGFQFANANSNLANALAFYQFNNVGPLVTCDVILGGNNYTTIPTIDVLSNTAIRSMGILGRMEIIDGGLNYGVGNTIEFINVTGGYGVGALANVTNVAANGMITGVQFVQMAGHIIGGSGYDKNYMPIANVISGSGNGANIVVTSILGDGETILATTYAIGQIQKVTIVSGGSGYETPPTLNLQSAGDGTAVVNATIVTGVYSYPGRWLNDDGHLSGYNFLEDRDYYQNYSYVIRIDESINTYRKMLMDLTHPAGMKLFGHYIYEQDEVAEDRPGIILANTYYTTS